jgi:hypothetical protein
MTFAALHICLVTDRTLIYVRHWPPPPQQSRHRCTYTCGIYKKNNIVLMPDACLNAPRMGAEAENGAESASE